MAVEIGSALDEYLAWDDWRVLGLLANGSGGEHAERLRTRNHFRRAYKTPEVCTLKDRQELQDVKALLADLLAAEEFAAKSWYKTSASEEIQVIGERERRPAPLSKYSNVIANLKSSDQVFLYVRPEHELVSTIVYTDRESNRSEKTLSEEDLARRVRDIKPRFAEDQIMKYITNLRVKGLLKSLSS